MSQPRQPLLLRLLHRSTSSSSRDSPKLYYYSALAAVAFLSSLFTLHYIRLTSILPLSSRRSSPLPLFVLRPSSTDHHHHIQSFFLLTSSNTSLEKSPPFPFSDGERGADEVEKSGDRSSPPFLVETTTDHHHHQKQQQQQQNPLPSVPHEVPGVVAAKEVEKSPPFAGDGGRRAEEEEARSSSDPSTSVPIGVPGEVAAEEVGKSPPFAGDGGKNAEKKEPRPSPGSGGPAGSGDGSGENDRDEVFHDSISFLEDYQEMKRSFKIYVYPHSKSDPHANALLPEDGEPGGNYASESYFKKALMRSHFITDDPSEADLFYLPFSISGLRHDRRVGVGGIPEFIRKYMANVKREYPYWNRSNGADHFYVACHSIGKVAMTKAVEVTNNAIQLVCSSNYFLPGYVPHKDPSLPQVWPRKGDPPRLASLKRKKLAFFAGTINSPVRKELVRVWGNDSEIAANSGRLRTPYSDALLGSKFCLHAKGYEVNTARIGDAIYYGCVPVILANHYDLPFADTLNWESFSVVVSTVDIPLLKEVLRGVSMDEYARLQRNVLKVRRHFQWHSPARDYDAFYMAMYELWLRRSVVRFPLDAFAATVGVSASCGQRNGSAST